jgi:FkbM family methyltransferase
MVQKVYNGAIGGRGELGRFCRRLRRWILKFSDPLVRWELNGRPLRLRLSHQLPFYRREFPTYSANLERLAKAVRRGNEPLVMVDVGANIGDSLALAGIGPADSILLIEGNPEYMRLLRENTADLPNAVCVGAMLSDQAGGAQVRLVSVDGTGQVVAAGERSSEVALVTLDSVLRQHPRFLESVLLKSDVDGYDFRVLRGAAEFVRGAQPVLFFEQHPLLLRQAGEQPDAVWPWLAQAGYSRVLLYDHFGYWLGSFALTDRETLCGLNAYALQRKDAYYDVVAFAPRHEQIETRFTAAERIFYGAGPSVPSAG